MVGSGSDVLHVRHSPERSRFAGSFLRPVAVACVPCRLDERRRRFVVIVPVRVTTVRIVRGRLRPAFGLVLLPEPHVHVLVVVPGRMVIAQRMQRVVPVIVGRRLVTGPVLGRIVSVRSVIDVVRAAVRRVFVQVAADRHERFGPGGRRMEVRRRRPVVVIVRVMEIRPADAVRISGQTDAANTSRRLKVVTAYRGR